MSLLSFAFEDNLHDDVTMPSRSKADALNGLSKPKTLTQCDRRRLPTTPQSARKQKCARRTGTANQSKQSKQSKDTIDSKFKSVKSRPRSNIHKPKRIDFNLMVDKSVDTCDLPQTRAPLALDVEDYFLSEHDLDDAMHDASQYFGYNSEDVVAMMNLMENEQHANLLCVETLDHDDDAPRALRALNASYSVKLHPMKMYAHNFKQINKKLATPRA